MKAISRHFNLRVTLLLVFLIVGLVPLVATGLFNILSTGDILRERVINDEQAKLQGKVSTIERFLGTTLDDIHLLSQSVVMREMTQAIAGQKMLEVQPAREALSQEFANFVEQRQISGQAIYARLRFLDTDGFEFVRVDYVDGQAESVTNLNFRTSENYFVQARDLPEGDIYISPINLFDDYGRIQRPFNPVLQYSTPIYADDTFVGVLVTDVRAQGFLDLVQTDLPSEATAFLTDSDGYYLSHPDVDRLFGHDLETGIQLQGDLPALSQALTAPTADSLELENDIVFHQRIIPPGQSDLYWVLFSMRPLSAVLSPVRQQQNTLLFALALFGLSAVAIALYFARRISLPIITMTRTATRIAEGDLAQRVPVEREDEIGQLGTAFNSMTQQLSGLIDHLEERVTVRTRDLQIASDVSRQITTVLDIDQLLQQVVTLTASRYKLYASFVFLPDEANKHWVQVAGANSAGEPVKLEGFSIPFDAKPSVIALAARTRHTVPVNDVTQSDIYLSQVSVSETRSEVAIPMMLGNQLLGVFDLQSDQADHFTDDDIRVMETLAEQIAVAVRNAQLFAEAESARAAAEKANQVKSQFLANMSHELRTPLNAILNFTGFVADGILGPVTTEQTETLNKVITSGSHLLSLINDILDLTKIEVGMMDLFIERVDLNESLTSLLSTAKGLIKGKNIEIITDIDDDLPIIAGDRRRIRQVLLNLLSNAAKFTQEGSITISAHHREGEIHLSVRDTGIGIPDDQRDVVFESFRQAKHELLDTPGTGLGMPISKAFVEAHGGKIWFESEAGIGTTFYVTLPVKELEAARVKV